MAVLARIAVPTARGTALIHSSTRADGDFNADVVDAGELAARQRAVVDLPWTWLREVHGNAVVTVSAPGQHAGTIADAAVTDVPGAVLSVWVGDCAPVALVSDDGVIGAAHAGWRGVMAGVLPSVVAAMRALGASTVEAHVGPFIHPGCYEFGDAELDPIVERFGPAVLGTTTWGTRALDLGGAVRASLAEVGVEVGSTGPCTACGGPFWSHRARGERARQVLAVWLDPSSAAVA